MTENRDGGEEREFHLQGGETVDQGRKTLVVVPVVREEEAGSGAVGGGRPASAVATAASVLIAQGRRRESRA